jgi:hypothetical protein
LEKASIEIQGQTEEKPKISLHPNGPYYLLNDIQRRIVENLQNSKVSPFQPYKVYHYADAGHLIINHFVMEHMEQLDSQPKIEPSSMVIMVANILAKTKEKIMLAKR